MIPSKKEIGLRLKNLRIDNRLSQAEFAQVLGLSRSNYSQIELGNQFPTYDVLIGLSKNYNKSYEWILHGTDVPGQTAPSKRNSLEEELITYSSNHEKEFFSVTPTLIHNKQIVLIENHQKSGYIDQYKDTAYLNALPELILPTNDFSDGYFRAFEIEGDSMKSTLLHNDIVICRFLEDIESMDFSKIFIIVCKESIVIQRITNFIPETGMLVCSPDNKKFLPTTIPVNEIKEVWQAVAKFSTTIAHVIQDIGHQLNEFDTSLVELKLEIQRLKSQSPDRIIIKS